MFPPVGSPGAQVLMFGGGDGERMGGIGRHTSFRITHWMMCLCVAGILLFLAPVCASLHLPLTVFCKGSFYLTWWNLKDFFFGPHFQK